MAAGVKEMRISTIVQSYVDLLQHPPRVLMQLHLILGTAEVTNTNV